MQLNCLRQQHSGRFSSQFWAAITHGHHTPLVFIRRRLPSERRHKRDKGGMDAPQYVSEVLEPHLMSFLRSLPNDGKDWEVMEDLSGPHKAKYTRAGMKRWVFVKECGLPIHQT